jgi:DNA-binding NarL/FixJ family response regulator
MSAELRAPLELEVISTSQLTWSNAHAAVPDGALSALVALEHTRLPERRAPVDVEALTPRQRQIVDLIARGATDREIAELLRISRSTAHKHVQNALRRANARTRSQLAAGIQGAAEESREPRGFGIDPGFWNLGLRAKGARA